VQTISENEFIKKARQQKWRLRGIVKKDDVPQDKRKKAIELIGKLGNDDFDVRKKAKNELIKMGDDAIPFLEENLKHSDPEVRMNVKEILDR
jgi:HEAT repeat protein